ncbi:SDP1L [Symbiodinium sp. CCMP2592]|nr:SDP1L [Symbiodinium sp. CCMP2592]
MEIVAKSIASPATARVLLTALKLCWRVLAPEVFLRQLAALAVLIIVRHSLWRTRRWLRALSAKTALPNSRKVYKEELKQARRKCADYKTFQSLGEKLDKAEGKDKWKREDNSPLFDSQHLRERTKRYREMMARGDVDACMYALRGELLRKHFGICNPALFQVCNTGTKVVIEEYVATVCEAMAWVGFSYNSPSTRTDLQTKKDAIHERLAFFNETKHGFGRSALLLSGGASVGMYHFGVVKALHLNGLLPRVMSGTSAGSIVCGMLGVRTDAELMEMWNDTFSWSQNFSLDFFGDLDVSRFLKTGQELYSSEHLGRILRDNMGDLTFLEAFDRTGRIINITVSGLPGNTRYPMLLNYLTSPHVLVRALKQGVRSQILDRTGCRLWLGRLLSLATARGRHEVLRGEAPIRASFLNCAQADDSKEEPEVLITLLGIRRAQNLLYRLGQVSQSITEDELRAAIDVLADPLEGLLRDADAEVDARTLSRMAISIARVHLRLPSARLRRLAEDSIQLLTKRKTANPQDMANAAWALGKLQSTNAATLATELLGKVSAEFGAVDLAQSLWSCATLKLHSRLAQPLLAAAAGKCSELSIAGLSSVIWSAATLAMADVWACQRLGDRAQELADRCRARELANLTWSFTTLRMLTRPLAISFAAPAAAGAEKFKCQELANIAWAFASATVLTRRELAQTFRRLTASAQKQASKFKPQELCNFSWALVAAEAPCAEWLAAAAARFESSPAQFNSKDLVQLTWSFARASSGSTAIAGVAKQAVQELQRSLSLQDLADLMWSCAKTQVRDKALLQSFTQSLLSGGAATASRCKPIELSNLAWSIVKLGLQEEQEPFLSELCRCSVAKMADFKPVELANLSYSLARASIRCVDTFAAIAQQAEQQLDSFTACDLSYAAWAFATANILPADLFHKIAQKSTSMLGDFTEQGFSDLVWSFAISSVFSKDLFMAVQMRLHQGLDAQMSSPSRMTQHADHLRRLVWAMNFSGILTDPTRAQAQQAFRGFGEKLDAQRSSSIFACFGRAIRGGVIASSEPGIAWEASGLVVLHKPAGWKVDTEGELEKEGENCLLSSYQQVFFQRRSHPIIMDAQHSRGFLHRLDIPSSGLVTCALTYKAFWDLQQQLVTGGFAREYVSLCYGWAPVGLQHIGVNIFWNRRESSLSKVGQGKTSVSDLKVVAHCARHGEALSLLLFSIRTGRRHQIRTQSAHLGHAVVCDGKYTAADTFNATLPWCQRNFLHRCRLAFHSGADHVDVEVALPRDLELILNAVDDRDHMSASHRQKLLTSVWSAAQCSAAVPGIFESRELLAKDRFGEIVPYVSGGLKWQDGSMQSDLPMARLAELFNVNYFIVSQVNPQAMLLTGGGVGSQKGPIFRVAQFLRREIKQYLQSMLELFRGASGRHPWLRPVGNTLIALVVQEYEGDVTIYNGRGLLEFPKLLKNPTDEVLRTYTKASEWETWWHIPEIQNACAIEFVMDEIVKELLADLRASEEEMSPYLSSALSVCLCHDAARRAALAIGDAGFLQNLRILSRWRKQGDKGEHERFGQNSIAVLTNAAPDGAQEEGGLPKTPDKTPSCWKMFCDFTVGGGLLSVGSLVPAVLAVNLAKNHWDDECDTMVSLRSWLMADGIIVMVMSVPGLYSLVCCGQAQGLNKCLWLPALALVVWGVVTYYNPDVPTTSTTTTTTSTTTTTTTGTGITPIVLLPCEELRIKVAVILLTQCVMPIALCNYVVGVLGGAGLVSGLLAIPAAVALCSALAEWDAECRQPLVTWLFIHGLILSLVPGFFMLCLGMDSEVVAYARLRQKARSEQSEYPVDVAKEETLGACAHHVNTCLVLPTLVLLIVGAYMFAHTTDSNCNPDVRWWARLTLVLTALAPVLGSCCVECCDTRSSGIPGACWDPPPPRADDLTLSEAQLESRS